MTTWAEWRAFLLHNLVGHGLGYCVVWPFHHAAGRWIHDATLPRVAS